MKALILAAGFGTRLLPFTQKVPKPLFTLSCKPILQITIEKLINAGFKDIFINTHYLSEKIQEFISTQNYAVNINTVYEPEILDTGGAISNLKDFLCDEKFLVINSDIITNIDLKKIYNYHQSNKWLATLVLHNYHEFNKVKTDDNNFIIDFNSTDANLAFTGIQVLSPGIFKHMPDQKKFSSIDLYKRLLEKKQIKSYISVQ